MKTVLIYLLLSSMCFAQKEFCAKIILPTGSIGSCVIVEKNLKMDDGWAGYALTCCHVVMNKSLEKVYENFTIEYESGRKSGKCYTMAIDKENDVAIIRVWIPDEVVPCEISSELELNKEMTMVGYPYGKFGETFGKSLRVFYNNVYSDIIIIPGYSGGGLFNGKKLSGIVSGGIVFGEIDVTKPQFYWPTISCKLEPMKALLEKVRNNPNLVEK